MTAAVIAYLVLLCLHHISLGCHQLHVEHLAEGARAVILAERDICLEPHCLAKVVGAVVEVQEHTLLLHHAAHLHCPEGSAVKFALRGCC